MPSSFSFDLKSHVFIGQFFGPPLVVVLRENLHAIALCLVCDFDGFVVAAGDGLVGAEDRHGG